MKQLKKHNPMKITLIVAAIVVLGSLSGWLPVDQWATAIVHPISQPLGRLGGNLQQKLKELGNLGNLEADNQQLREQNHQLSEQLATFHQLQAADRQLREQLGLAQRSPLRLKAAEVTNYQNSGLRRLLRINRGSKDGLELNMAVMASGSLVGRISQLRGGSAEVMLISDPDFRALVATTGGATGVIKGQSAGQVSMERIPQGQPVAVGERVVTSALDDLFPKGLVVGKVESIQTSRESIFSTAQIKPLIDLDQLEVVMVVLK